jgi:thiamine phosphate synthase YjbQ (UPF0047 family)
MRQALQHLHIQPRARGLVNITTQVREFVAPQSIETGLHASTVNAMHVVLLTKQSTWLKSKRQSGARAP